MKAIRAMVVGVMLWSAATVQAGPITIDGGWEPFSFGDVGSFAPEGPFTFTALVPVVMTINDAFLSGDQFSVHNFAFMIGVTSVPGSVGDGIGSDYDGAAADPRWSSGVFALGPGLYSIDIGAIASPFGGGGGAIRVDSAAVPEPASMALVGLGAAGMMLTSLRRRARRQTV